MLFRQAVIILVVAVLTAPAISAAAEYDSLPATSCDSVLVDSTWYMLPTQWCGWKLDSADIVDGRTLVRLPDSLTYEGYRIYVTRETHEAFVKMATAASRDSIELITDSGFRSPGFQMRIIKRRLKEGQEPRRVFREVAPPGYSQHHTGRALDLVPSEARFAHTETYQWLQEHAAEFGFEQSYPDDPESPFPWESWHWMYVAK